MHSFTGHSAITEQSTALATLGKYKYLLSLVGASASLIELHSRPFTRVRKRFCKQNRTPPRRETRRIRLQSEGLRALRHLQEFFDSLCLSRRGQTFCLQGEQQTDMGPVITAKLPQERGSIQVKAGVIHQAKD